MVSVGRQGGVRLASLAGGGVGVTRSAVGQGVTRSAVGQDVRSKVEVVHRVGRDGAVYFGGGVRDGRPGGYDRARG